MPRIANRRSRPLAVAIIGALVLAVVGGALVDGAQARVEPFITFTPSRLRPGQSVTVTYGGLAPRRAVVCIWIGRDPVGCQAMPQPSGTESATFGRVYRNFASQALTISYRVYRPSDIGARGPKPNAIVLSSATLRLVPTPTAPTIASLTRGEGKIRVVANAPRSDYGSAVIAYQTRCVSHAGTFTSEPDASERSVIRHLPNHEVFRCSSRAQNARGWSIWGRSQRMTTSDRPPLAPDPPAVVEVDAGDAALPVDVILAKPLDTHGGTITAYQARCVNGDTVLTSNPSMSRIQPVAGLTPDTVWACSGRARNTVGWSEWSTAIDTSVAAPT